MNPPRIAGHLLLWVGFLTGAFIAVRSTEDPVNPWATLSWPAYGLALLTAIAGVFLLRSTQRRARLSSAQHADDVEQMEAALKRILRQLRVWQTSDGQLPVHEVHVQIDERLASDLGLFSDLRESLIDAFGLEEYARIMTEFALAERTINRIWSASADGYVDEVDQCLDRSTQHLESAIARLQAAQR
jgi:hypothetical protein